MFGYATDLRSMTQGRAVFTLQFSKYQKAPNSISQEVLEKVIFPLGNLTKEETREEASRYNLRTAKKPESQDFCLAEH